MSVAIEVLKLPENMFLSKSGSFDSSIHRNHFRRFVFHKGGIIGFILSYGFFRRSK